jgi:hypothetical protein
LKTQIHPDTIGVIVQIKEFIMFTKIDWISFTLPIGEEPTIALQGEAMARNALRELSPEHYNWIFNGQGWDFATGRPPYKYGFRRTDGGAMIYVGSNTGTILFEVSGRGCEDLADLTVAQQCIERIANNVSRIDIACDMPCEERPGDFVNARTLAKGMSIGFQKSSTGETVYLGSMKSDRYCRVYRYDDPHPRAELLRFEAVYRRDYAKALAWTILDADDWKQIAATVGKRYGWQSENWKPGEAEPMEMSLPRPMRHEDKTVLWLLKTCAPALARCVENNALTMEDFMKAVKAAR